MENDIERIWHESVKKEIVNISKRNLITELNSQMKSLDRNIGLRNGREIVASVVLIVVLGTGSFFTDSILSKIGLILGAMYGILVIFMIKRTAKLKPDNYTLQIREYLLERRMYLKEEKKLLDNVIYWYLLPPFICCVLFFIGQKLNVLVLLFSIIIVFVMYVYLYILNKRAVKKVYDPMLEKLEHTIMDFDINQI
jgi:hypothetical protein